jgi:hypothetical protein
MPTALRKHTTFESALKKDADIINQAAYQQLDDLDVPPP